MFFAMQNKTFEWQRKEKKSEKKNEKRDLEIKYQGPNLKFAIFFFLHAEENRFGRWVERRGKWYEKKWRVVRS